MRRRSLTPGLAWHLFYITDQDQSVGELFGCHWWRLENAARLLTALQEVHGAMAENVTEAASENSEGDQLLYPLSGS